MRIHTAAATIEHVERLVSSPRVMTVLGKDAMIEQGNDVQIGGKLLPSVLTVAVVPRKSADAGRPDALDVAVTTTCDGPVLSFGQARMLTDGPHDATVTVDVGATVDVPQVKCFHRRVTMKVSR